MANALTPQNLGRPWADLAAGITAVMMVDVEHIDRVLSRRGGEKKLGVSDFTPFIQDIEDALFALKELDIDETVREFLTDQLLKVKQAVDEYRFRGMQGLQKAFAGYAGAMLMSNVELSKDVGSEENSSRLNSLYKVITTGAGLINAARSVAWLWPHLPELLSRFHQLPGS